VTTGEGERSSGDGTAYADRLAHLFNRVITHGITGRALSSGLAKGLTPTQFDGLRFLARHPNCAIGGIADGMDVSYPAATRLVHRLEKRGLAVRAPSKADGRVVEVTLTELGAQVERSARAKRAGLLAKVIHSLSDARRRALVSDLERFLSAALTDERMVAAACLHCGTDHDPACPVNRAHIALTGSPIPQV
jgi:DNA-binding MarR family transcriptional regulator